MKNDQIDSLTKPTTKTEGLVKDTLSATVLLFNDDCHTFEEVARQIIKATNYSTSKAKRLTWVVHVQGKALVFKGDIQICIKISNTLEEIDLRTRIEF